MENNFKHYAMIDKFMSYNIKVSNNRIDINTRISLIKFVRADIFNNKITLGEGKVLTDIVVATLHQKGIINQYLNGSNEYLDPIIINFRNLDLSKTNSVELAYWFKKNIKIYNRYGKYVTTLTPDQALLFSRIVLKLYNNN